MNQQILVHAKKFETSAWQQSSEDSHGDVGRDHRERRRTSEDAALALATLALQHADVAILTERRAPRILHLPVLLATVNTIADGQDTMIQVGSAQIGAEDTFGVQLKERAVGLNCNRHRAFSNSLLQSLLCCIDILVAGDGRCLQSNCAAALLAIATTSLVAIGILGAHTGRSLQVLECGVHKTTIAALVTILVAINELLLRELLQVA